MKVVLFFFFLSATLSASPYTVHSEADGGESKFEEIIDPVKTVLVVMDPWIDHNSFQRGPFLKVIEEEIIPLSTRLLNSGYTIVIMSEKKGLPFQSIHPYFQNLIDKKRAYFFCHARSDADQFSEWLKKMKINTIIYTGLASNQCVIGRPMGMINMMKRGFRLFFVPEASAAVETRETFEGQEVHKASTITISQWIGRVIHLEDLINSME